MYGVLGEIGLIALCWRHGRFTGRYEEVSTVSIPDMRLSRRRRWARRCGVVVTRKCAGVVGRCLKRRLNRKPLLIVHAKLVDC